MVNLGTLKVDADKNKTIHSVSYSKPNRVSQYYSTFENKITARSYIWKPDPCLASSLTFLGMCRYIDEGFRLILRQKLNDGSC